MKQIAIYGKGGIGKSTLAANLSLALAQSGLKVLQIGCDPKHDSTRLLLGGEPQETVLQQLRFLRPEQLKREDILREGAGGVHCVEAGGPEPGVGCAGRGILSMAQALEIVGLDKSAYDMVLYDVLGDVVCGGFAVPMRDGYAEEIYVVTSGEVMALYAANNICKGLLNFGAQKGKLGGIIGNSRDVEREEELLKAFAERLGTRLLALLPRDPLFREAEAQHKTILAHAPHSPTAGLFKNLARHVSNGNNTVVPSPLSEEEFESFLTDFFKNGARGHKRNLRRNGRKLQTADVEKEPLLWNRYLTHDGDRSTGESVIADPKQPEPLQNRPKDEFLSKAMRQKEPLHSCAMAGAFSVTNQILDAVTVMHSPAGCAHTSLSGAWLAGISSAARGLDVPVTHAMPNLLCTNMTENDMVFGGEGKLRLLIEEIQAHQQPKAVFIITSCPSAIIGDNPERVIERLPAGFRVVPINSDGIMGGDYTQGMINAYRNIAEAFVDESVRPEKGEVNIIGESPIANVTDSNHQFLRQVLTRLGGKIHCRFLRNARVEEIRLLKKASLNILANFDLPSQTVKDYLKKRFSLNFFEDPSGRSVWPMGREACEEWTLRLGAALGEPDAAQAYVMEERQKYEALCKNLRAHFRGVRVLISAYEGDLDWVVKTLSDVGAEVVKIGLFKSCQNEFRTAFFSSLPLEYDYTSEKRLGDINNLRPDLVLTNYVPREIPSNIGVASLPLQPQAGFCGPLRHARQWALSLHPLAEGWRSDFVRLSGKISRP